VDGEFAGICPRCLAGLVLVSSAVETPSTASSAGPAPAPSPLRPGAHFGGFEILDVLGQGGMGIVYKARQESLARTVALKVLVPRIAASEEFARRFDREAKVLASLNHPNVVQVHDFGHVDGVHYLVMEYVDGESLETAFRRGRPDPEWLIGVLRDVARGLQRVHEAGLVHRDLKPANVLIARDGTAKIGDFGLAVETETRQRLTEQGYFVGTPHYVSPEHAKGERVDGRSDLYSLGVILYEGFAGRPPFEAHTPTAVLVKHIEEPAPALDRVAPRTPAAVAGLVERLLAKEPDRRLATAADLERALEAAGTPRAAKRSSAPYRPAGFAALLILGLACYFLWPAARVERVFPLLASADEALRRDRYDEAAASIDEARKRGGDDPVWGPQIRALAERISAVRTDREALGKDAADDEEFGQFLCFSKGDWDRGLPMIAAGEESPYRTIAKRDLARPADSAGRVSVADGWLEAAASTDKKRWAERMKERAWAWLSAARSGATAAQRRTIETKLQELDATLEARREIDLLKLSNPEKFAVAGEFSLEGGRLHTPSSTPFARMSIPYLPPDEYDLDLIVERRTGDGALYLGLPRAEAQSGVELDARGQSRIDGRELVQSGRLLQADKPVRLSILVRRSSLEIKTDAGTGFQTGAAGGGIPAPWAVPEKRLLFLGSNASAFVVSKLTLRGALSLNLPAAAPAAAEPPPAEPIDLLARIRPVRDAVKGDWKIVDGALISPPVPEARIQLPYEVPDEYDLVVEAERRSTDQRSFHIGLPIGGRGVLVTLDGFGSDRSALENLDGRANRGPGFFSAGQMFKEVGIPVTVRCAVRRTSLTVTAEGKVFLEWEGDPARLEMPAPWQGPDPKAPLLGVFRSEFRIRKVELISVSGTGRPVAAAAVNLLEMIRPKDDTVKGDWTMSEGVLSCKPASPSILQIPYVPPDEYDLTVTAARKAGFGSLNIGLAKGDVQFMAVIDGVAEQGYKYGLHMIDGWHLSAKENETGHHGRLITNGTTYTIVYSIRKDGLQVTFDGKTIVRWKGDWNRLANEGFWRVPNENALFLGSYDGGYRFSAVTLTPVTGEGKKLR
jgi:predicted Ser/Thr protein kinase